jgi:hypothetical protein
VGGGLADLLDPVQGGGDVPLGQGRTDVREGLRHRHQLLGGLGHGGGVRRLRGLVGALARLGLAIRVIPVPSAGSSGLAVRVQVSGTPGLSPLARVTVPAFPRASSSARAVFLSVPAAAARAAVVAPGLAASTA